MNTRESIGIQIMEARKKKNLTQLQLSELSGVNRTNIAKIETGRYNVSIDILSRICDALSCEINIREVDR